MIEAATVTWNYTTYLNIVFLALAAALVWRYFRSGGGLADAEDDERARARDGHAHHCH